MKKFLIITNALTLCIIYFQSCSNTNMLRGNTGYQINRDPLFSACYNCSTDDIHGETAEEFVDVTARYRTTHFSLYNQFATGQLSNAGVQNPFRTSDAGFKDARSCWYSVDTLKKFICLMEKYSARLNIPASKLGVRFYYGTYPSSYPRDPQSAEHHTLYLTATAQQGDGVNADFDPRVSANRQKITPLSELLNPALPTYRTSNIFVIAGNSNVTMNQGDLCPPGNGCRTTLQAIDGAAPSPVF